jgi:hypothetical protein
MIKKRSPIGAKPTRPHVKENKDTSKLPKAENIVKKLLRSDGIVSHTYCQYKVGGTVIESHHILIERIKCSSRT